MKRYVPVWLAFMLILSSTTFNTSTALANEEFEDESKTVEDGEVEEPVEDNIQENDQLPKDELEEDVKRETNQPTTEEKESESNDSDEFEKENEEFVNDNQDEEKLEVKTTQSKTNNYEIGDKGPHVKELKMKLTELGFGNFPKDPSTVYGKVTSEVVKDFQAYYNLSQTGIADQKTLDKIESVLHIPYQNRDRGIAIVELKQDLSILGFGNFPKNPSIFYGSTTTKVVKDFQKTFGLNETGIADKETFNKIDELLNSSYAIGQKGNHIRELKQDLTKLGFGNFPKNPSTAYGEVTANVVKDFQAYYNFSQTGIADQKTLNKIQEVLNPPYQNRDRGLAIVELKQNLSTLGFGNFPKNPSIFYGSTTTKVVKEFQKLFGLNQSGITDKETINKIDELLNSPYAIGQKGSHVRELKQDLTQLGFGNFPKNPSTAYGEVTANVVKEFQTYYKLSPTGIADQKSLDKIQEVLNPPYQNGDRGLAIVELKQNLSTLGFGNFPKNPSIFYGSTTTKVVKEFQKAYKLDVDGVVGEQTLDVLSNPYKDGSRGKHIIQLKKDITKIGFGNFPESPSNSYGSVTTSVVKEVQKYYGLSQTGNADKNTLQKIEDVLNSPYQMGKKGTHIVQLKKDLTKIGFGNFPSNPSQTYGEVTASVVKEFQRDQNLVINGIADEVTLAKIADLVKNGGTTTTEYTDYKLTLEQAVDIQINQSSGMTDKYRNDPAYVSANYLRLTGSAKVSGSRVNIRTAPNTTGSIAFQYTAGTPITITGTATGTSVSGSTIWYKISQNGKTYYIHSSLVSGAQAEVTGTVNVRAGKGTSYHSFGKLQKGERVNIITQGPSWHEISYSTWREPTRADIKSYLDPSKNDKFQHLRLDSSVGVSASELNNALKGKGTLEGQGQAFINGAKKHGVNEAYLIAHAFLETGHGTSTLAKGVQYNGKTVYNMFGIGAVDSNPINGGAKTAYENGWFTPAAAIEGGAKWIGDGYIYNEYNQNTLYKMRWNPRMSDGYAWKQYATDIAWAHKQVTQIKNIYNKLNNPSYHHDIPRYK